MPKKKILILTASPKRDILIDQMIAKYLTDMGNEAKVAPCLRAGRDTVLEYQPDVVIVPPVRNMYSRDFCEELKRFGCGIISRHTEPSCDWPDFKAMNPKQKAEIMGNMPYYVDLELVWSQDEEEILNRRPIGFKAVAVGSFSVDKYLNPDYIKKYRNRTKFNRKHKLKPSKITILIQSPWGFAEHLPDLMIDEVNEFIKDTEGRDKHLNMIESLYKALPNHNILVTTHPGVITKPYKERLDKLGIPLDTESTSMELMLNSDILVHAGSIMAIGAHFLKMPAFQFGDVNLKDSNNWWHQSGKVMAELSPNFKGWDVLVRAIKKTTFKSNANLKTLEKLEQGRYGKMDGKATERAAALINKVQGKFKLAWPRSTRDYTQLTIQKHPSKVMNKVLCGICKEDFYIFNKGWLGMLEVNIGKKAMANVRPKLGTCCPNCGSKFTPREPQ